MTSDAIVTIILSVFGGGAVGTVVQALTSWRKGIRDSDVSRDQTAIQGFKDLAESLRDEVARLKAGREEDRARMDRIEKQIAVERDLKWTAIQHIRALYAWITQHITGVDPPAVPEELAPHIVIARRGNED